MKEKCILVTGSTSGIGSSITQKLLNCGAKVIGVGRNHSKFSIDIQIMLHMKLKCLIYII